MGDGTTKRTTSAVPWWLRLWLQLRLLIQKFSGVKELSAGPSSSLPHDLRDLYRGFHGRPGVVADTVHTAVTDYQHLRDVVLGPGATADAVDDVSLLADAEETLREILRRAPELQILVKMAGTRKSDRHGREATGEAMLAFRERGQALGDLASAALRWASSGDAQDLARMRDCVARLPRDS